LQLEQESLSKLLRLRRAIMASGSDIARQRALLTESVSTVLVLQRAVLRLRGEQVPVNSADVPVRVGAVTGLPTAAVSRSVALARGTSRPDTEVTALLDEYLDELERLVRWLDEQPLA
jgi:hypothetical protein